MEPDATGEAPGARPRTGDLDVGDIDSLRLTYVASYERLVGLARLLVDDLGIAEEIVQEAFVRTYDHWPKVRDHAHPLAYVRQTVINLSRGVLRTRGSARWRAVGGRDRAPDPAPPADTTVVSSETRDEIADAIRSLPARQRECVVLRFYLDCSVSEVASALGISDGAVKSHLHRAMAALGDRLGQSS